ncbi:MAG TPA: choice-of-anchor Q domain-containing protein, partial [Roseiflexaceae bacterium]|nr:choice-of-anchor Q domain-containing protein [Roseiflexaceae bacterium]
AASTLIVNITSDTFDGLCDARHCSLRDAIWVANAIGSEGTAATIVLPGGIFMLTRMGTDGSENTARFDDLDITAPLNVLGAGADLTTIDANGVDRAFDIVVAPGTPVQLRGLTIRGGNTAGDGGGIANNGANLQLQDVTLRSNVAGGDGGGMFNQRGLATIVASRIAGNYAGGAGGNIANNAEMTIQSSEISVGHAQRGAGIANSGALAITISTVSSNVAELAGGGIANLAGPDVLSIRETTLAANSAPQGGAFWNSGSAAIVNSIIAAGTGGTCSNAGVIQSAGSNLDQANTCGFNAAGDQQNVDPLLALLAWNGGTTRTHALAAASPAVDQGRSDMCSMSDQRGFPRLRDGNLGDIASCDVGAYELSRIAIHLPLIMRP